MVFKCHYDDLPNVYQVSFFLPFCSRRCYPFLAFVLDEKGGAWWWCACQAGEEVVVVVVVVVVFGCGGGGGGGGWRWWWLHVCLLEIQSQCNGSP